MSVFDVEFSKLRRFLVLTMHLCSLIFSFLFRLYRRFFLKRALGQHRSHKPELVIAFVWCRYHCVMMMMKCLLLQKNGVHLSSSRLDQVQPVFTNQSESMRHQMGPLRAQACREQQSSCCSGSGGVPPRPFVR